MGQKTLSSMMHEKRVFYPPEELSTKAYIKSLEEYKKIYQRSLDDPEAFWGEAARQLDWYKKWDKVLIEDFAEARHEWFVGGKLNVSYNCLDRNLKTWRKNKAALMWEGDTGETKTLTYQELYHNVCKFANVLKKHGIKKGDRVSIYMPMVLELPIAMLACARIGAIHSIVFGGFSADSLADRILDSQCRFLITTNAVYRGAKAVSLKDNADRAMQIAKERGVTVEHCVVTERVPSVK